MEGHGRLELERIIGFNGDVPNGLKVHPDKQHIIYPLGCNIIIENITNDGYGAQDILSLHTDYVSCLAISPSGRYLASGQVTHMGFKAVIIIWDYATKQKIHEVSLHKVKVEALTFSCNEKYLISLGGQDDGSVVVWDVQKGEAICGSPAQVESAGNTYCVCASDVSDDVFVTGGDNTLRVWTLDVQNRKIRPTDVNLGVLKRIVTCIQMVNRGKMNFFFCGTTTGDILAVNMNSVRLQFLVPEKNKFSKGVTALSFVKCDEGCENFDFLVGAGDGTLAQVKVKVILKGNKISATLKNMVEPWKDKLMKNSHKLTSIALRGAGHQFFVGSSASNIYMFNYPEFSCVLKKTCHSKPVNDVTFPQGTNELIVTCQDEEIRIWHRSTGKEIRRYFVANMMCNAIEITRDGKRIISAWADGKIRVYGFDKSLDIEPKLTINDAHNKGVTAIACTSSGREIVSGGGEGQVRIWRIEDSYDRKGNCTSRAKLQATMKEHKATVSAIKIRCNDKECVSASTDGTCIIWDLMKEARKVIVFANTLFQCVQYGFGDAHIVTSGTDRKIAYWETLDGSHTRELDGASSGAINTLDMSPDGHFMVSGGEEKLIKVWLYNEGEVCHRGSGHSAPIKKVKICPQQQHIVSVSTDGAILIWKFPEPTQ